MNIFQFLGLAIVTIVIFFVVISLCSHYSDKFSKWMTIREERKWDMNLFPVPERIPELKPYKVERGINREGNKFTYSFKANGNESARHYHYKNPKEALENYVKDFQKEERAFFERNKEELIESFSNSQLIEQLQDQSDRIEATLNKLKHSLGETND